MREISIRRKQGAVVFDADTSMPLAEGNHPNPCLPLGEKPFLMVQATRMGFARSVRLLSDL
jgi:hypothetical protein